MIPDDVVDRVREAADIVQIIGEHVSLKRTGADFRGPCPFHQGTHRNFSVSARKGIYYCFVCHEGGDVFTFLQKRLGFDWPSAVKYVAERAGIEVREVDRRRDAPDPREPLWEVTAAAAQYFRELLWDEREGRLARDYLALRRVTREVADLCELGYAPVDPAAMRAHLHALGFEDARLLEAGLVAQKDDGGEIRPRFRNRLVFPIHDSAGRHVGFGGRLLGPGEPKYLNSPDSTLFSKAKLLYGLHRAKHNIRREDRVLVVEGYFDVVRLVSVGIDAVVAPLGTALTDEQARLLARYTRNAFLLYDSDRPGLKATFRAGDLLLRHGFAVQVVTLPEGEDPDSFVDKHGGERLIDQLGDALDIFERKVQLLERAGWFGDLRRKRRALDRLLPTIRATADPLTRDMYLTRASEAAGVTKALLERELGDATRRGATRIAAPPATASAEAVPSRSQMQLRAGERRRPERRRRPRRGAAAERDLVLAALLDRSQIDGIGEHVGPEDFHDSVYRETYERLITAGHAPLEAVVASLSEEGAEVVQQMLAEMRDMEQRDALPDVPRMVNRAVAALRVRALELENTEIDGQLSIASDSEKDDLIRRKRANLEAIRALHGAGSRRFGKSRP